MKRNCIILVLCMAFILTLVTPSNSYALSQVNVHVGKSTSVEYSASRPVGYVVSSNDSIVTTSITSKSIHITNSISYVFTVSFSAQSVGSATVSVYNEYGSFMGNIPVVVSDHIAGDWITLEEASCEYDGEKAQYCIYCSALVNSEIIPAEGHDQGSWKIGLDPTCTEEGENVLVCGKCGFMLDHQSVPVVSHIDGNWEIKSPATCKEDGERIIKCVNCSAITKSEKIPAAGIEHTPGELLTITEPTCTEPGKKEQKCMVCQTLLKTEEIPALGHTEGEWKVIAEPTCTEPGKKEQKCMVCQTLLKTEEIPALGHTEGEWKVITDPTCTELGKEEQKCAVCQALLKSEDVQATGHDQGKWIVTKKPTQKEEGEHQLKCTKCNALLKTETLPIVTAVYYYNNTACSLGIRFRDMENSITDKWYMYTPIDLTKEGIQNIDLIASNAYKIGSVQISVVNGEVSVSYDLVSSDIKVISEFFTLLPSVTDVASAEPENFTPYTFGKPISIEKELNNNDCVFLFVCNVVDYNTDIHGVERFISSGAEYRNLVHELNEMIK